MSDAEQKIQQIQAILENLPRDGMTTAELEIFRIINGEADLEQKDWDKAAKNTFRISFTVDDGR